MSSKKDDDWKSELAIGGSLLLIVLFVIGVIIFAIIKWAFGIVF